MLKNTRLKVFPMFGGVVLATATILSATEFTQFSSNSDSLSDSSIVLSSKPVNAAFDVTAMEKSVHEQINEYRSSKGLSPLKLNDEISAIARKHSKNMADNKVSFGHNGSKSRYKKISQLVDYRSAAENVAYNQNHQNPAKSAVTGWLKSFGHHRNIVGKYQVSGIGIAKNSRGEYYFTQLFVNEQ